LLPNLAPTFSDVARLRYTDAVLNEAMRLWEARVGRWQYARMAE